MTLSKFTQSRITAAHVMVVGCGALGNEVLKQLALHGVGHLVIVDYDRVESDNLSRSILFSQEDARIGRTKVEAAAERLRTLSPDTDVTTICGDIAYDVGLGLMRRMDVVIGCVDNRLARYYINRLAMRAGVPWVDGGIDGLEGTARVFVPGKNCYACNLGPEGLRELAYRMPCAGVIRRNVQNGKAPTTSIAASIIGAVQVQEALKLLHPESLANGSMTSLAGKMFCYEGEHLTTRTVAFLGYDEDCPEHEQWTPIVETPISENWCVGDVLSWISKESGAETVSIELTGDCFVDYVSIRSDDTNVPVMRPGRQVAPFVEQHPKLSGVPFSGLYQHEWREIDRAFPYQDLTLAQLGIPRQDVLSVEADGNRYYYEMTIDNRQR